MSALTFFFDRLGRLRRSTAFFLGVLLLVSAGCNQIFGIRLGHRIDDEDAGDEEPEDATGGGGAAGSTGGAAGTAGTKIDASTHDSQNDVSDSSNTDSATCTKDADCSSREHVRPGAPVTCAQGKCKVPDSSCVTGWIHCSANPDEFCETDVTTPQRCGTCTNACGSDLPLCRGGECVTSCMSPTPDRCEATCVDTKSDLAHCGKCNQPCAFPNADATCSNGECKMGMCKPGYGDCSSAPGCETRLNTLTNCGACNTPCGGDSGDVASCETGTCIASCVKKGPEECYNGVDDDCDGKLDCEDSDCTPTSICEPVGTAIYGTTVGVNDPCPMWFNSTPGTVLYSGFAVDPMNCTGCGCSMTCGNVNASLYSSAAACTANTPSQTVQLLDSSLASAPCTQSSGVGDFSVYSVNTTLTAVGCKLNGAPTRVAPTWGSQKKFCPAPYSAGGGCQSGSICVPKPPTVACLSTSGSVTCAAAHTAEKLYTGYNDARQCSCACNGVGNCADLPLETSVVGTQGRPSCGATPGTVGSKKCVAVGSTTNLLFSAMAPPPNNLSCSVNYGVTGAAIPTGETTLCCREP